LRGVKPGGQSHALDGDVKPWVATFASVKIGDERRHAQPPGR